jgi:hypothetical protein
MSEYRNAMLALLKLKQGMQYRLGVIQMAVMVDVISQSEWLELRHQVLTRVDEPRISGEHK